VPDPFHALSHHQNDPAKIEKLVRIGNYHTRVFAAFVGNLADMPDGDGSDAGPLADPVRQQYE
jgi:hypothetical protein